MRTILLILLIGWSFFSCQNKSNLLPAQMENKDTLVFDSVLAKQLGADNIGMKTYVIAFLKRGPVRSQDSATAAQLMRAHLDNIGRLAKEGKLILAGPFLDDTELRGIYLFDVTSIEEARKLTETDPAIQAGRLVMELHPWYGSAALMKVPEIHEAISQQNP